jgi:hypothetical protein
VALPDVPNGTRPLLQLPTTMRGGGSVCCVEEIDPLALVLDDVVMATGDASAGTRPERLTSWL